jgi:ABC-type transport system involved in multi-copper enzyme maturation permease subunit
MANLPWGLWAKQALAVMRLETSKNFLRKRSIPVYLLAGLLPLMWGLHALAAARGWNRCGGAEDLVAFAGVFQIYLLRLAIFFSAVAIFMNLFRGEALEKTLHYYFLVPVRREVLVAGKFLSGLSVAVSYLIVLSHMRLAGSQAAAGPALADLPAYVGIAALGCLGYGAVFLILGLLVRNPIVPAAVVLVWESLIIFMPAILKKFSVAFYLESMCPVKPPYDGPGKLFAIAAEGPPAWLAVIGLIALTAAALVLASVCARRMEIKYGTD